MKKQISSLVIVLVVSSLLLGACAGINGTDASNLSASGTIASSEVRIAPQVGGQVVSINVEEGQQVKAGDELFRLDDSLLRAQYKQAQASVQTAEAALKTAQTQYDITLTAARAADNFTRIADWIGERPDYFEQPTWFFTREEQIAATEIEVAAAETDLASAQKNLEKVVQDLNNADYLAAEQRLSNARIAYLVAKDVDARAQVSEQKVRPDDIDMGCPPLCLPYRIKIAIAQKISGQDEDLLNTAQDLYDEAKAELDNAQQAYDDLLTTQSASDVQKARAGVVIAQERLETARDRLSLLHAGAQSQQVAVAQAAVQQAEAAITQSKTALSVLEIQLDKTIISAPVDGIVLTRGLEVGETLAPGGVVITIGQLQEVELVVYIPETVYGNVNLGDQVSIVVDSVPGETFTGSVTYISDKAEFTPRNVQT
ncbi:partial hypothetical protein, partial [Anaerolineales bacterium]